MEKDAAGDRKKTRGRPARSIGLDAEEIGLVREFASRIGPFPEEAVDRVLSGLAGGKGASEREEIRSLLLFVLGGDGEAGKIGRRAGVPEASPASGRAEAGPGVHFLLLDELSRLAETAYAEDLPRRLRLVTAISKLLLLDLGTPRPARSDPGGDSPPPAAIAPPAESRSSLERISEALHDDVMWNFPEMVLAMNAAGAIVEANRAAREILGYEKEEMQRLTIRDLIAESHHPRIGMHLDRVIRDGKDRVEAHIVTRDGEEKHVELVSAAVRDGAGKYLGARIFMHDVANRKKLEQEMLRLERLVAVGSMAAKVAHEIRNPLSSISLNVDLLLDEIRRVSKGDSPEAESLVRSILSEIDRLTSIIEEYLSFGRLPSPSLETVDPGTFLHSVADFVRPDLQVHDIRLTIDVLPGTPPFLADRNQVRQSLLNLFRNSQEAMPSGGSIKVITGTRDGEVVIEVHDSGVGIPKEEIRKIFDPFYTTKDFGTGLGLAFVQRVMREHHGRVTCRSEVGSGTVFTLHFPSARE
jgi:PAS domain S-box-containing protein